MSIAVSAPFEPTLATAMGEPSLHLAGTLVRVFAAPSLGRAGHGIAVSAMAASGFRFHERQGSGAQARAGRQ